MRSENFDLELPDDFPVGALEALHLHLTERRDRPQIGASWGDYSSAANGLIYRFRAADEDVERVCESLNISNSPAQPERYIQERDLFGFSFQGLSAVECLFFAVYFVGAMIEPTAVSPTIDRRDVKPRRVANVCSAAFGGQTLATRLRDVLEDSQYQELVEIRNFLSHRGAPGRGFFTGGEFMVRPIGTSRSSDSTSQPCWSRPSYSSGGRGSGGQSQRSSRIRETS